MTERINNGWFEDDGYRNVTGAKAFFADHGERVPETTGEWSDNVRPTTFVSFYDQDAVSDLAAVLDALVIAIDDVTFLHSNGISAK